MVTGLRALLRVAPKGEWELERVCETTAGMGAHDGQRGV